MFQIVNLSCILMHFFLKSIHAFLFFVVIKSKILSCNRLRMAKFTAHVYHLTFCFKMFYELILSVFLWVALIALWTLEQNFALITTFQMFDHIGVFVILTSVCFFCILTFLIFLLFTFFDRLWTLMFENKFFNDMLF